METLFSCVLELGSAATILATSLMWDFRANQFSCKDLCLLRDTRLFPSLGCWHL